MATASEQNVTVKITGGSTFTVPFIEGMNVQQVLERAYAQAAKPTDFTFALQYYGPNLGYLVLMINETYESYMSTAQPFFFWEFLVNGTPAQTGIDNTVVKADDVIGFSFMTFDPVAHAKSTLKTKFDLRTGSAS